MLRLTTRRLRLRPATDGDLGVLKGLLAAAPPGMAYPGAGGEFAPDAPEQLLQSAAVEGRRQLLIVEEGETGRRVAVGLLVARLDEPWTGTAFVELLLLLPLARGRGYGREILECWQGWAERKARIREIQAAVRLGDGAALAFWAALGYRDTGEVRRDDAGRRFRVLALRLGTGRR